MGGTEQRVPEDSKEQEASLEDSSTPQFRIAFFVAFLATFAFGVWLWPTLSAAGIEQPIAFNHLAHVEDGGLECADCHPRVFTGGTPGLPGAAVCADCHEGEPMTDSPEEVRLLELLAADDPLAWTHLFRQPPHVFFPHRRHVVVGQMECRECHGDIGESSLPPQVAPPKLTMEQCLDCHTRKRASIDCTACHR